MPPLRYVPKEISGIKTDDTRISVIGNVTGSMEGSFILGDDTGKIEILSDAKPERNKTLRVFCSISGDKLKADIIQDLEGMDLDLLKKINSIYNSTGV